MKRWVGFGAAMMIFAAAAGILYAAHHGTWRMNGVGDAVWRGGSLYLIDEGDGETGLFRSSLDGTVTGRIRWKKQAYPWYDKYCRLVADDEDDMYLARYQSETEGEGERVLVYRCDFDRKRLEPRWETKGTGDVQVSGGQLYTAEPWEQDLSKTAFYRCSPEGEKNLLYLADFRPDRMAVSRYYPDEGAVWADFYGNLYFNGSRILESRPADGRQEIHLEPWGVVPADTGSGTVDVFPYHQEEDGSWTAGVTLESGDRAAALLDQDGDVIRVIDQVHASRTDRLRYGCQAAVVCLAAASACAAAIRLLFKFTHGQVPIVLKLIGILVPVVVIGCLVIHRRVKRELYDYAVTIGYDRMSEGAYGEAERLLWIRKEDGFLHSVYGSGVYENSRADLTRGRARTKLMEEAVDGRAAVRDQYEDQDGRWLAVYTPWNARGQAQGVMESRKRLEDVTSGAGRRMERIRLLMVILILLFALSLIVLSAVIFYPLARLRDAVDTMAGGRLGTTVRVRGRDEIAGIARAFNTISSRLKDQMEYIEKCLAGYARFVPGQVFEILGRQDVTQVEVGDQKEIEAGVMMVRGSRFEKLSRAMEGEELYGMINRMFQGMIPIIAKHHGIPSQMREDGLSAFYPSGSRAALESSISICELVNRMREEGEILPVFRIAIASGRVKVGIIGEERCASPSVISEVMSLSSFLMGVGETYGARILITGSAAEQIPDLMTAYHARLLGYIYIGLADAREAVYDVYDGDAGDQRRLKQDTAKLFDGAVEDYLAERFYDAREKFARVLRINRNDLAARTYVYRCDDYYQNKGGEKPDIYMERY